MNQLTRTVEHITAWEKKQISDFQLIQDLKGIIMELADEIIRLETEKVELKDSFDVLIEGLQKNGI